MKNKFQDALEKLVAGAQANVADTTDKDEDYEEILKYEKILQKLVDKEVPIKPKKIREFITFNGIAYNIAKCPKCKEENQVREYILMNRCYICGQKIDWSDKYEKLD